MKNLNIILMLPFMFVGFLLSWAFHGLTSGWVLYQMASSEIGRKKK